MEIAIAVASIATPAAAALSLAFHRCVGGPDAGGKGAVVQRAGKRVGDAGTLKRGDDREPACQVAAHMPYCDFADHEDCSPTSIGMLTTWEAS